MYIAICVHPLFYIFLYICRERENKNAFHTQEQKIVRALYFLPTPDYFQNNFYWRVIAEFRAAHGPKHMRHAALEGEW